jgi:hypothetical protein
MLHYTFIILLKIAAVMADAGFLSDKAAILRAIRKS